MPQAKAWIKIIVKCNIAKSGIQAVLQMIKTLMQNSYHSILP